MPIGYTFAPERRLIMTRAWGDLSEAQVTAYGVALTGDPRFDRRFVSLSDLREASLQKLRSEFVARFKSPLDRGSRRAVVVSDDVAFGLVRMHYALHFEPESSLVVRDLATALQWLALPDETRVPVELEATFGPDSTFAPKAAGA
jgi:hypothetical protein